MNAIATVPAGDNNSANYNEMLGHAHDLGASIKTGRERQRKLARSFVLSAVDDNYQLEGLIEDAKGKLKWALLASDEKNRMNVFFTQCRTIVGAWGALTDEVKANFRAGKIVYSTLVTSIKEARKAAEQAEVEAEEQAQAVEQAGATAEADVTSEAAATLKAARLLIEGGVSFEDAYAVAELAKLAEAIDALRASMAQDVTPRTGTEG